MVSQLEHPFDSFDRPKSPFAMDTSSPAFTYEPYHGFDYLQFPHSPFNVATVPLPGAGASPKLTFDSLNLTSGLGEYAYSSGASFTTGSPARPFTPPDSICPPALSHLSAGEMSSDSMQPAPSGRRSRGSMSAGTGNGSPASTQSALPTPRNSHRFNPLASRAASNNRERKRRASKDEFASDEEDDDFQLSTAAGSDAVIERRREEIRRQRIESEQRRRDELRDGYRRLKDVLPVSNQKSSKVSLLDRATTHIKYLEMTQQQLQTRLNQAEMETQRLRNLNEALMLSTAEHRHQAAVVAAAAQQPPAF